jgi:hypothetical protein
MPAALERRRRFPPQSGVNEARRIATISCRTVEAAAVLSRIRALIRLPSAPRSQGIPSRPADQEVFEDVAALAACSGPPHFVQVKRPSGTIVFASTRTTLYSAPQVGQAYGVASSVGIASVE